MRPSLHIDPVEHQVVYLLQQQRTRIFDGQISELDGQLRRPLLHPETQ